MSAVSTDRTVTVIPATLNSISHLPVMAVTKKRVAAYARVSTASDEQFTSYEAQIDYYTQYIRKNPEWEFVKVYSDEGITGTSIKNRQGFNDMVNDALAGKIDLIVTKSVSRFARNTVDGLVTIRKLKEAGCECFFEKENIYTFDGKGELLLTIMSSLAQEESRSISENVTWGQRKRFADGKVSLPYKQFLGYEKGPDGLPQIVPEEARTVRRIYSDYMRGKTAWSIARELTQEGVLTPSGKKCWQTSTIESILSNEKYKGSAILQKSFTVDFLSKKKKANEGEIPQYYIEHSHEAIIDPDEWDAVQTELQRRKTLGRKYSGKSVFSARIICGDCGSYYGSKVWHSNSMYRKVIWQCNHKFKGDVFCTTPHLDEEDLKRRFIKIWNDLLSSKTELVDDCQLIQDRLTNTSEIDKQIAELTNELEIVVELTRRCVENNAHSVQDQEDYSARYAGYVERYEAINAEIEALETQRNKRIAKANAIRRFTSELVANDDVITVFDEQLFLVTVDSITAFHDGRLVFRFIDGTEIDG